MNLIYGGASASLWYYSYTCKSMIYDESVLIVILVSVFQNIYIYIKT